MFKFEKKDRTITGIAVVGSLAAIFIASVARDISIIRKLTKDADEDGSPAEEQKKDEQ